MAHPARDTRAGDTIQEYPLHRTLVTRMRRLILLLFCASAMTVSGQGDPVTAVAGSASVRDIAPDQLEAMMRAGTVFVYDCNEPETFAEAHVPGAVLTVYDEVTANMLPPDRNAALVFYCYSPECPAGASAAHTAIALGYTQVLCMTAGIIGWQDAGLKTEP